MVVKDNPGWNVDNIEICIGKNSEATPAAKKVILFGDCAIKQNQKDARSIPVHGCPPEVGKYFPLLMNMALPRARGTKLLLIRMIKHTAFKMGLYAEKFGRWEPYRSYEFDRNNYEWKKEDFWYGTVWLYSFGLKNIISIPHNMSPQSWIFNVSCKCRCLAFIDSTSNLAGITICYPNSL